MKGMDFVTSRSNDLKELYVSRSGAFLLIKYKQNIVKHNSVTDFIKVLSKAKYTKYTKYTINNDYILLIIYNCKRVKIMGDLRFSQ